MTLRPDIFFLIHQAIEELVRSFGCVLAVLFDLRLAAHLCDRSKIALDGHVDTSFFPGFASCGFNFAFVGFPAAFGQNPAFARGGLD